MEPKLREDYMNCFTYKCSSRYWYQSPFDDSLALIWSTIIW